MRSIQIYIFVSMAHLALFAAVPAYAADAPTAVGTPSQRIARLATEARERWLDLSPVSETMGAGAGPRQDRMELMFTETHRERQREHNRWVLRELEAIPFDALNPSEKLTYQLLAQDSREGLEWLSFPWQRHYIFIQLNGGVANNLINLVGRQPFRHDADYQAWLRRLARYPQLFDGVADVMREGIASRIHARIVPQLPRLFGRFPKVRFEIRLTDPAIAASTPAQWYPPSDDGTRPGVFAMPVVNPRTVSIFGLEALLAHEGMPGHHFDGGLKLESDLRDFRRRSLVNAFGEGWGLYAESLGHELGLYDTPMALMGRYSYELFRACRLVVDTGLHAKDWPRERAISYLVDECGSSPEGATSEVLRYMAWPGQALGYKIGELTINDIRASAEKRLGPRFDIRAFHDALLAEGHLPLTLARMAAWVEEQAKRR